MIKSGILNCLSIFLSSPWTTSQCTIKWYIWKQYPTNNASINHDQNHSVHSDTAPSNSSSSTTGRCIQLGRFIKSTRTKINSAAHATSLIGMLQMANGYSDGIVWALGCSRCTAWFDTNISFFFHDDGLLGDLVQVSSNLLLCHFNDSQTLVQILYCDHSNDQTGSNHDDYPEFGWLSTQWEAEGCDHLSWVACTTWLSRWRTNWTAIWDITKQLPTCSV